MGSKGEKGMVPQPTIKSILHQQHCCIKILPLATYQNTDYLILTYHIKEGILSDIKGYICVCSRKTNLIKKS